MTVYISLIITGAFFSLGSLDCFAFLSKRLSEGVEEWTQLREKKKVVPSLDVTSTINSLMLHNVPSDRSRGTHDVETLKLEGFWLTLSLFSW